MKLIPTTILLLVMLSACSEQQSTEQQSTEQKSAPAAEEGSGIDESAITQAAKQIEEAGFMAHVNILASDEFEGRAPSTPGGRKTVEYLEQEYAKLGLAKPFTDADGTPSYRQAVELIEQEVTNSPALNLTYEDGSSAALAYKENAMLWTTRVGEAAAIENSQLVFVGYGVVAPEFGWNDYAGVDMTGKTAVILVNDPGFRAADDSLFKGNTMTYYGRWTYKYEEAARQGAAGAIVVHETAAAGYPWEVVSGSWSGPQYMLFTEDGNAGNVAVEGWITQAAAENLFAKSAMDYQKMVNQAGQAGFKPVPLKATASVALQNASKRSTSYNVGGIIPGSKRPDEIFIYTAHWDHLGKRDVPEGEDGIYNGAQDNATGTSGLLELAQAFTALPQAPERSIMMLAVTAEESGLLGSRQYAANPPYPMAKHVAGINMDALLTYGETDDVTVIGFGNSELDNFLRVEAERQGRVLVREPSPEKGYFYRSDHFNLAKKGVPMLYAKAGIQVRGKDEGFGKAAQATYTADRYHKPADEVHAEWNNGGALQDLNMYFRIGVTLSNGTDWPQWTEGNEFRAIREASLAN